MKRYIKPCAIGICYGFLPVILAWLLVRNLWAVGGLICKTAGLEPAVTQQIVGTLQQLQTAKLVLPWLLGVVLSVLSVGVLLLLRKRRKLVIILGCVLILPLAVAAFCLAEVNGVRAFNVFRLVLPILSAL